MKVEINGSQIFDLAEDFSEAIHSRVVQMHLRKSWGIWEDGALPNPYLNDPWQDESLQNLQRTIRSIRDPYERRSFIHTVKVLFKKKRDEKRGAARWQDYVTSVRAAHAEHEARRIA